MAVGFVLVITCTKIFRRRMSLRAIRMLKAHGLEFTALVVGSDMASLFLLSSFLSTERKMNNKILIRTLMRDLSINFSS